MQLLRRKSRIYNCPDRIPLPSTKFWKRFSIAIAVLILVGTGSLFTFFKLVEHKIAARLAPPILQRESRNVPDLTYRTLDGQFAHISSVRGKVVFLNLWGTWCVQCVAEMPSVQKLYDHYRGKQDIEFLIVSRLDSPYAVRSYARRHHLDLPFYVTQDADIPSSMQLNQYPSTLIYARDGSIAAQHAGASDWSDELVIQFIDRLRQQK